MGYADRGDSVASLSLAMPGLTVDTRYLSVYGGLAFFLHIFFVVVKSIPEVTFCPAPRASGEMCTDAPVA